MTDRSTLIEWLSRADAMRKTRKGTTMKSILSMVIGASLACCAIEAGAQEPITLQKIQLDISRQSLTDALNAWAEQTGFQLVCLAPEIARELVAPKMKGAFTATGALDQLLSGTPLVYEFTSERMVTVRARFTAASQTTGSVDRVDAPRLQIAALGPAEERTGPDRDSETDAMRGPASRDNSTKEDVEELEEIVVTGTHIHGSEPVGSRLIVVDRNAIQKSGYTTIQSILQSLPENFSGGVRTDSISSVSGDPAADSNSSYDFAPNLRGLGAGSTLTLLNGRRLAPGGTTGQFAGIASIPLGAVDRIEVLPDGASALYGSDAVGGVVNIITRKNYRGAESSVSYGSVTSGGHSDLQVDQVMGTDWSEGSGMLFVSYGDREPLLTSERDRASSDLRPFGGDNFDINQCNPGTIIDDSGTTYAIPQGQSGAGLTPEAFAPGTENRCSNHAGNDLIGAQRLWNALGSMQHRLSDRLTLFSDASIAKREATNRFGQNVVSLVVPETNPFFVDPSGAGSGATTVLYNLAQDLGPSSSVDTTTNFNGAVGAALNLSAEWTLNTSVGFSREKQDQRQVTGIDQVLLDASLADSDPLTAFNPFGDGSHTNPHTLATLRGSRTSAFFTDSKVLLASAIADGPVARVWGGAARLAIGFDYRKQSFDSTLTLRERSSSDPTLHIVSEYDRNVSATFGEVILPLVGEGNQHAGAKSLDVSFAARYEKYSDFGGKAVPKAGFSWVPTKALTVRGTWGKAFRAPNLSDLDTTGNFVYIIPLPDVGGTEANTLLVGGNSRDLSPETATTWSLGFQFAPDTVPSLVVSPSYFEIDYTDRITGLPSTNFLTDPADAPAVTRILTPEYRAELCASGVFFGNFGTTAGDCMTATIDATVDSRLRNLATVKESGLDLVASYTVPIPNGSLEVGLNGTYLLNFSRKLTPSTPLVDFVNTAGNPIGLKVRGAASWSYSGFVASAFLNYLKSYNDTISVPAQEIASWTTVDASIAYHMQPSSGVFGGMQVALAAQNVFDEEPPFYNNSIGVGFDPQNATLVGRFVTLSIRKTW